jgi:glutamine amidotransferase
MCRLYALRATHPTRAACELLDAQNALIQQSREDARGLSNPHGWGMGRIADGAMECFRQTGPASESASYRSEALSLEGTILLAHVRRATVGDPSPANTHPFRHGGAMLIHNGHVPAFDQVRPRLLDALSPARARAVQGTTDSEHVLALLLQLRDEAPGAPLHVVTRRAVTRLQAWCAAADPSAETRATDTDFTDLDAVPDAVLHGTLALNLLWTDGDALAGSRLNRTLFALRRTDSRHCPVCGAGHARPTDTPDGAPYRSLTLASERLTDEAWTPVPNGSVFKVGDDATLEQRPIE